MSAAADLPTLGVTLPLLRAEVVEELDKHTLFRLRAAVTPSLRQDLTAAPLRVRIHNRTFVGYVNSVKEGGAPDAVTIVGVGATWPMKSSLHRSWTNATLDRIVSDVTKSYYLRGGSDHRRVYDHMSSPADESDWEFLVRLAHLSGLHVETHGTEVRLFNPAERYSSPPLVTRLWRNSTGVGSLLSFTGQSGAQVGDRQHTSGAVFGAEAGALVGARGEKAVFSRPLSGQVIRDNRTAREQVSSAMRRNYLVNRGTVKCWGNPQFSVGQGVHLSGTNQDGVWMTTKVTHTVASQKYLIEAEVASPPVPLTSKVRPLGVAARSARQPRLVGRQWRS